MKFLTICYRKICSVIQHRRNKKGNEERLLKPVSCFSLKSPIFNKRNSCIYVRVMLLDYFTYDCLDHILIHYCLCNVAKHFVSLDKIAESESLASYIVE